MSEHIIIHNYTITPVIQATYMCYSDQANCSYGLTMCTIDDILIITSSGADGELGKLSVGEGLLIRLI
jgi:hypothetical protein